MKCSYIWKMSVLHHRRSILHSYYLSSTLFHLSSCLVGKSKCEYRTWLYSALSNHMSDTSRQCRSFSTSRSRNDKKRSVFMSNGFKLFRIVLHNISLYLNLAKYMNNLKNKSFKPTLSPLVNLPQTDESHHSLMDSVKYLENQGFLSLLSQP